jgi:hypothetical protein
MAALPHTLTRLNRTCCANSSPPGAVGFAESEDLWPYECDGLSVYRQIPLLAVLPSSEAEVVRI